MGLSDFVENKLLDHLVGGTAYQPSAPLYLALTTVAVTDTDTGSTITQPTYAGYARQPIAVADWSAAANGEKHNLDAIEFPEIPSGSYTIVGFAICTALTGGEVIAFGAVPSATLGAGVAPQFPASALSLTLD